MNAYELRNEFTRYINNTAITREDFEAHFQPTKEKVIFTFQGWDGKSYDGESRRATVYRTDVKGYEGIRFIKVGKSIHYIEEDCMVMELATGVSHPRASWLVDVMRKAK